MRTLTVLLIQQLEQLLKDLCYLVFLVISPFSLCSGFLESLCYSLYDILRPLIIKVIHLETLAELCNIVKVGQSHDYHMIVTYGSHMAITK